MPPSGPFRVTRVLDGDTVVLDNGETVRLIGVDAPETHHPEIPVQRFGEEATEFLRRFAEGFECTLEYEPDNIRDQYGRLLAYLFIGDRLANAEIIRLGYAYAYTRFPFRRQTEFVALEREARKHQYGLWHLSIRDGRIANLQGVDLPSQVPASRQTAPPSPQSGQLPDKIRVIPWQDAAKHYGEYITVEGTIVATHNSGKACFLNFHPDYKRYLTAVIFASVFSRFPGNPENYYHGKKVHVSGYIREYNGKPDMVLNNSNQIEILK